VKTQEREVGCLLPKDARLPYVIVSSSTDLNEADIARLMRGLLHCRAGNMVGLNNGEKGQIPTGVRSCMGRSFHKRMPLVHLITSCI
jgi:hypothetical protein